MKANEFIKKYGIGEARAIIDNIPKGKSYISGKNIKADFYDTKFFRYGMADGVFKFLWGKNWEINSYSFPEFVLNTLPLSHLKRLIESHDRVMEHGSIDKAKEYAESKYTAPEIKIMLLQAIADVESCQ